MFRRSLTLLTTLFSTFLFLQAQPIPVDPSVLSGQLSNGLSYYIKKNAKPDHRAELRLVVKAGSILEEDNQLGVAHFVEHMAFNGTEHFAKNDIIDFLERAGNRFGADLNAYTSFDETVYKLQVRTDSAALLDQGFLILSDWAGGITFDPEEVEKERGVVISEWRTGLSPDQRLQQQYYPVLFKGSQFADRLPIGLPEIIEKVEPSVIKKFYQDWYRPELMAIIVVGDVEPEKIAREIKAKFGGLKNPTNPKERTYYTIPFHTGTQSIVATDPEAPFTQIRLQIKQKALPDQTVKDFAERLKVNLYNKMLGARMYELQQTSNPPFTFASTGYGRNIGETDTYSISAFVGVETAREGFASVYRETLRAFQYGFTSSELDRAKADLLASAEKNYAERENIQSGSIASNLVYHFLDKNPVLSPEQYLDLLKTELPKIQPKDIHILSKDWFGPDNRTLIITGPEKASQELPKPEELIRLMQEIESSKLPPYIDQISDEPLFTKKVTPGMILEQKDYPELSVTEWTLDNGVKVVLKPTDLKEDEILVRAFRPGGHSLADLADFQSAQASVTIANLSGLSFFSAPDLLKKLSGKVVNVGPFIDEYAEGINGNCTEEELETLLQLTYLYFVEPSFTQQALDVYKQRQSNILANITDNPYYYFANLQSRIKYQDHPRRQGIPTLEDLDKIDLEVAEQFYRDRFDNANGFVFLIVGSFDVDSIQPLILQYLGGLPANYKTEDYRDLGITLAPGVVDTIIHRGQAPKAIVDLTFHGNFEYTPENRYTFASMISVLEIKLREKLREELGGVYGVRLNGYNTKVPREKYRIGISFNSDPDMLDTLLSTTKLVIQDLQKNGPNAVDLEKVKETQIQSRIKAEEQNSYWMAQLQYRYQNHITMEGATQEAFRKKVAALSEEDIQSAAQQYFDFESRIKMVLLPERE